MPCWPPLLALAASRQVAPGYYDPGLQHWIKRDPIQEIAGAIVYRLL
jgi:hypothetical protein